MRRYRAVAVALALSALLLATTGRGVALAAEEASSVITVPGSVVSLEETAPVSIAGTPTVTLSAATITQLASAIASATAVPTVTVSAAGTLPVSVVSVASWDSSAVDAFVTLSVVGLGVAIVSRLSLRNGPPWT